MIPLDLSHSTNVMKLKKNFKFVKKNGLLCLEDGSIQGSGGIEFNYLG